MKEFINVNQVAENVDDQEKEHETKILLFDAPFHTDPELRDQALDDSGKKQEIPRGALAVGTLLSKNEFPVEIVSMDSFMNKQIKESGNEDVTRESFDEIMLENVKELIETKDPKVIGFSYMFLPTKPAVRKMIEFVKQNYPDKVVVVGGNSATFDGKNRKKDEEDYGMRKELLDPSQLGVDVIINGEGEWSMLELMESLEDVGGDINRLDLEKFKGISYWDKENETVINNQRRERGNPSEIGPNDYELIALPEGTTLGDFNHCVLYARGCMGGCTFCSSPQMWRHIVSETGLENYKKELENVVKYVSEKEGGDKNIGLLDDDIFLELGLDAEGNIALDDKEVVKRITVFEIIQPFLQEIKSREEYKDISFIAQTRVGHLRGDIDLELEKRINPKANTQMQNPEEVLRQMKECGVREVLLGIESGSQVILDTINKQTKVEWVRPACQKLHDAGIDVGAFWIVGMPGSTFELERESTEFLRGLVNDGLIDSVETHVFVPLPGTAARENPWIVCDVDIDQVGPSLFNDQPRFEIINPETGEVVLSKAQIAAYYKETTELCDELRMKKEKENINKSNLE